MSNVLQAVASTHQCIYCCSSKSITCSLCPLDLTAVAPIAMDTSPWETTATKSGGDDEEWSAFEGAENTNSSDSSGWADFSNLDRAPASDGGPRMSSPDVLSSDSGSTVASSDSGSVIASSDNVSSTISDTSSNGHSSASDSSSTLSDTGPAGAPSSTSSSSNTNSKASVTIEDLSKAIAPDGKPQAVSMDVVSI